MVWKSDFGVIVTEFRMPNSAANSCSFSPDGRLVAVAARDYNIYIWDITGSDPHLIETLVGHTSVINSLVFTSLTSLISSSADHSVKFWQIGSPSKNPVVSHSEPTPPASAPIKAITLRTEDGVFFSSDLGGMVKTWDISTGLCKTSLQTPARNPHKSDVQCVNDKLIFVWHADKKIHIWDVGEEKLLREIGAPWRDIDDVRISGDGSKVFCLHDGSIEAWSTWTGEEEGNIGADTEYSQTSLIVNSSRVWVYSPHSPAYDGGPWGWDFGMPGSSPVQLPTTPSIHLSDTKLWELGLSRIKDKITGKVVLQLGGRFARPFNVQLDGRYFLAHYWSGDLLILDFNHVLLW